MEVRDAKTEMMTRIRSLDQEESFLRRRAEQLVTSANSCLDQADRLAQTRRQYEFAVSDLGGELEHPGKKKVKVTTAPTSARVIHVNQTTPA